MFLTANFFSANGHYHSKIIHKVGIMTAYNLMSLFKQVTIPGKAKTTLKILRFITINIGSYLVKKT